MPAMAPALSTGTVSDIDAQDLAPKRPGRACSFATVHRRGAPWSRLEARRAMATGR
jgi:hypothetical protein